MGCGATSGGVNTNVGDLFQCLTFIVAYSAQPMYPNQLEVLRSCF